MIGEDGVEILSVLGQCAALSHLNLRNDRIGVAGAESFAGVLTECPVLVQCPLMDHLDLIGWNQVESSNTENHSKQQNAKNGIHCEQVLGVSSSSVSLPQGFL